MPATIAFEDCRLLTDRWGDATHAVLNPPATADQLAAVESLLPAMYEEETFIAERAGKTGLLFEIEYDDGNEPTDADRAAYDAIAAEYPQAALWLTGGGDHIYKGRHAIRAFIPADLVTPDLTKAIGDRLMAILY